MSQRDNKHYITNMKISILVSLALLTLSCQETKNDSDRQLKKNRNIQKHYARLNLR